MVMYRAHCQRILDSIIKANFSEVSSSMSAVFETPTIFCVTVNREIFVLKYSRIKILLEQPGYEKFLTEYVLVIILLYKEHILLGTEVWGSCWHGLPSVRTSPFPSSMHGCQAHPG